MEEGTIAVVRGRGIVIVDSSVLLAAVRSADRVVLDLGAGDGRWVYRLARSHPDWFCLAVDANASAMREASFRAGRKPSRGGAANVWFVRAAVEALPEALRGLADEIHIHMPWGSLLRGVLKPQPEVLEAIARIGKAGAALRIRVNCAALNDLLIVERLGLHRSGHETARDVLTAPYAAAGMHVDRVDVDSLEVATSWGRRLSGRRHPGRVLAIDGTVRK